MIAAVLFFVLGYLLSKVLPMGETAPVYKPLDEAAFQRILAKRGPR